MKRTLMAVALVCMLALAAGASAQDTIDPSGTPNYASVYLNAGFPLDPYLVRVESSGTVDAASVQDGCLGVVPATPDVVVNWTGATDLLSFFVYSDVDPVLLVVTPSGEILCNDDFSLDTLNPVVSIPNPQDGQYAVYVGAYSTDQLAYGWLGITEINSVEELVQADLSPMLAVRPRVAAAALIQRALTDLDAASLPIFGATSLDAGFGDFSAPVTGAGVEAAPNFAFNDPACAGFVNLVPSYRFSLSSDEAAVAVLFNGEGDSTLIVRRPDGTFACNSDAADGNLNPALLLENALAGDYTVWVGTVNPNAVVLGTLVISEDAAAQPDVLPAGQ